MSIKAKTRRFTHGFDKYESRGLVDQEQYAQGIEQDINPLKYQNWVNKRFHGDRREREYDFDLGCWVLKQKHRQAQAQAQPKKQATKPKFRRKTNQKQRLQMGQALLQLRDLGDQIKVGWV